MLLKPGDPTLMRAVIALFLATLMPASASELQPISDADFHFAGRPNLQQVELGRFLFYDKLLSGNRNISCATCHHPTHETGDGLKVSIGEGGSGLGVARDTGIGASTVASRVGRNAQALFNIGAREFTALFHDGRVEVDPHDPNKFLTPIGDRLPDGLENVLAAQALFPLVSVDEMAGQIGENDVADAVSDNDIHRAWGLLEQRIQATPEYVTLMVAAYPHIEQARDIAITDVGNAIAAFTVVEWRADESRFDVFLRGNDEALTSTEKRGYELFYGAAGCSQCHSGSLQTDHDFHAIAIPQIGPGKGHGFDGHEDFGREFVTGNPSDRYRFRTPSLRNVAHTGPWGHDGAFDTLEAAVRHHLDPIRSLNDYYLSSQIDPSRSDLDAKDYLVQGSTLRRNAIASRSELNNTKLSGDQIQELLAFLESLSDERSLSTDAGVPQRVPSGLQVSD